MQYIVRRARAHPELEGLWDGEAWKGADVAQITHFHAKSSDHHPHAEAKMLYDDAGVYVTFRVRDRYVVCRNTKPQDPVCQDSCAEFFVQPKADRGYFNFELNCGGALLLYYVTDPTRTNGGLKGYQPVAPELLSKIKIFHSMPTKIEPEISDAVEWRVEYFVPNEVFERYVGPLGPAAQRRWRGNFYKCADKSSHPHWGSWSPIGQVLNFHVPEHFGDLAFE